MKRHGNLWNKIIDIENLKLAHRNASKGKGFYSDVKLVNSSPEFYLKEIQQSLINNTFTTSNYEIEDRFDGRKLRTIYKLPYYPDRIVQHALLNVVGPIFVSSFIRDTFQSIPGRGTSDAASRIKSLIRSKSCPKFALKLDVTKYYPSVNNDILKRAVLSKIKCKPTLQLLFNIIDSMIGLPIGNYTSQHLGNLYLSQFDWWIKQVLKPKAYFRYCDDLVIMADSVADLLDFKDKITAKLSDLRLSVKPTYSITNVRTEGVDFVGYVFSPTRTKLRRSIAAKFKFTCKRLRKLKRISKQDLSSLMAYKGWTRSAGAKSLWWHNTQQGLRKKLYNQLGVVC